MKYFKYFFIIFLIVSVISCKKSFLERPPLDTIVNSNFYQTPEQLLQGTGNLYNLVWQGLNFKVVYEIEQRANVIMWNGNTYKNFRVSSSYQQLLESWQSFYNTIGQCNLVIESVKKFTPATVPQAAKNNAIAEARFIRAVVYSYLVQLWGEVPALDNNLTLLTDTTKTRNTIPSIWDFIMSDMRYAAKNLFPSSPQAGRLNKYSGEAMLARLYLTRAGVGSTDGKRRQSDLDSAAYYCRSVIANGPFKMLDDYEELFKMKNNNNPESIFALQWVFGGFWGTQNATQAFVAFNSSITGSGDGWGSALGAGLNILRLYEDFIKDKRRKASFMFPGDRYSYITQEIDSAGQKYKRPLIVPFNGNNSYTAGPSNFAWIKKYVVGRPEDNDGKVASMSTGINTYMMRMPEVYLTLAEAILGDNASTTNAEAVGALNKIRIRAGLDALPEITWYDIYKERMLEFAFENISTLDFGRLHYYNPQKAYQMLSDMNRGLYTITPRPSIWNPVTWEVTESAASPEQKYVAVTDNNFYLAIPDMELVKAPSLRKPAIPFVPTTTD